MRTCKLSAAETDDVNEGTPFLDSELLASVDLVLGGVRGFEHTLAPNMMHSGNSSGDHMWASATAPGGMPSPGINTAQIRENDPGLVGVAGGMYSIRPRTPTRPKDSDSSLHLRKTATYKNPPQSSIVLTRKASPRVARHVKQRVARKSPMRTTTAGSTGEVVLNTTEQHACQLSTT